MTNVFKRFVILSIVSLVFVLSISIVFFRGEMESAKAIGDVDQLSGQKIATPSGYEGDYLLTYRDDLTLLRYDTEADCLLALAYKQVDAIVATEDGAEQMLKTTEGLKINEKPVTYSGLASVFVRDSVWVERFNEFIERYSKTEEYQEYLDKCDNGGFYDGSPIMEQTGTGEEFVIGYDQFYIPVTFYDTINKCPNGSEVEIMIRFANDGGYKIKWVPLTEDIGYQSLVNESVDCLVMGYSDVYADEMEHDIYAELSLSYRQSAMVLVEVDDYDKLSIGNYSQGAKEE